MATKRWFLNSEKNYVRAQTTTRNFILSLNSFRLGAGVRNFQILTLACGNKDEQTKPDQHAHQVKRAQREIKGKESGRHRKNADLGTNTQSYLGHFMHNPADTRKGC